MSYRFCFFVCIVHGTRILIIHPHNFIIPSLEKKKCLGVLDDRPRYFWQHAIVIDYSHLKRKGYPLSTMTDDDPVRQQPNSSNSSRLAAVNAHQSHCERTDDTMVEENDDEYSIQAFRQKLDALTESLDPNNNNTHLEQILHDAKNTTPIQQIVSVRDQILLDDETTIISTTTTAEDVESTPQLRRFPMTMAAASECSVPSSRHNLRNDHHSTSQNRNPNSTFLSSSASPEPPTPVKTPLRRSSTQTHHHRSGDTGIRSHNINNTKNSRSVTTPRTSERRYTARLSTVPTTTSTTTQPPTLFSSFTSPEQRTTGTTTSFDAPTNSRETIGRHQPQQQQHNHTSNTVMNHHQNDDDDDDIQKQLHEMRQTLQQQDARIRALEQDNDILLLRRPRTTYHRSGQDRAPSHDQQHVGRQHYRSPGKQFVAEFVQIMDVPSDLQDPLSDIMDRQFFSRRENN